MLGNAANLAISREGAAAPCWRSEGAALTWRVRWRESYRVLSAAATSQRENGRAGTAERQNWAAVT